MEGDGKEVAAPTNSRVVLSSGRKFLAKAPAKPVPEKSWPVKVAMLLALARRVQREIDAGTLKDRAEAARRFGISRARVTQILELMPLGPKIHSGTRPPRGNRVPVRSDHGTVAERVALVRGMGATRVLLERAAKEGLS